MDRTSIIPTPDLHPDEHASSSSFENPQQAKRASLPPRPNVTARHTKRLTLNFPITVSPCIASHPTSSQNSPASSIMSSATQPSLISSPDHSIASSQTDANSSNYDFLTVLAAQERKVLELREELQKAEAELVSLKCQWSLVEKDRKKAEIIHRTYLLKQLKYAEQSVVDGSKFPNSDQTTLVPNHVKTGRELEGRNSHWNSQSSSPGHTPSTTTSAKGRTVFQGSKHTRTLSLLSTSTNSEFKLPFPQLQDSGVPEQSTMSRSSRHPRSATLPSVERSNNSKPANEGNFTEASEEQKVQWRRTLPPIARDVTADALMKTGRQMAADLREGLWTFIEDIRQAAVGEEGINGTRSRITVASQSGTRGTKRGGSLSSTRTGRSTTSRGVVDSTSGNDSTSKAQEMSFWSEFGIYIPDQTAKCPQYAGSPSGGKQQHRQRQQRQEHEQDPEDSSPQDGDDNWDMWDSPQLKPKTYSPSSSNSTSISNRDRSPSTDTSSPRTSVSFASHTTSPITEPEQSATKSDGIPWPVLSKFHPSTFSRTASHLMAEWERSLSSPEEQKPQNSPSGSKKK
ncbi:hypothetical protein ACO22_01298 [Paracoccidioides brasiliensis]|uniref:DUF4048 domain-containing protein n=1 Tax=Paracoccidioides brasiliensis TaxID=121759 RepID=A0A1D2JM20_PARBR|nr:hypothetical protein ACO22_01298 [Paracoccidioides brasiliensis]